MTIARRTMLTGLGAGALGSVALTQDANAAQPQTSSWRRRGPRPLPVAPSMPSEKLARNERYWRRVAASYDVSDEVVNLENGCFGVMPDVVLDDYHRRVDEIGRRSSFYMRTEFPAELQRMRQRVADVAGCDVAEVALTRGATEALQRLIGGYNRLKPGDEVLYVDLDYDSMQYAMEWLRDRRGATVVRGAIPEPATYDNVLAYYEQFLTAHPRARLLLLTHLSHRTGLVVPVAEIARMARERDVDVIVDAAHSWGQMDFHVRDLGAPFVGFNLHKWMGCPLGVGWMYIAKDRLADIAPDFGDRDYPATDIRSRIHTGTVNSANWLTIDTALSFHEAVGAANKNARLRHLRDRWVHQVRSVPRLQVQTPDDPRMYAALTSFRVEGRTSKQDSTDIAAWLLEKHGIFTVRRGGVAAGEVIRVTPALYNTPEDSDRLARALTELVTVF